MVFENEGYCFTCDSQVVFSSNSNHFRDHYKCKECGSIPRERALMYCIERYYPDWKTLLVHECSPGHRGASLKLRKECKNYVETHYFPDSLPGQIHSTGYRNENLECQTFDDESFDIVVTQDVMEHIFHPEKAFSEISRTLKPGGAHIFSVPLVNKNKKSRVRAKLDKHGDVNHLFPANYHGNPISSEGSLVTRDWGYDICDFIYCSSGLTTAVWHIDDISYGIRAELNEILVSRKPSVE